MFVLEVAEAEEVREIADSCNKLNNRQREKKGGRQAAATRRSKGSTERLSATLSPDQTRRDRDVRGAISCRNESIKEIPGCKVDHGASHRDLTVGRPTSRRSANLH